ncbi:TPA: hypothetical protein U1B93_000907 [Streptococcus suis]|nr:hypothetical protein [Streptococcus suis]HEM3585427.1 hypothetical protein [Streptococcus suis]
MTEAILTLSIFAVPMLAVGIVEQRKAEKERRRKQLALYREMELETLKYETWAQAEKYYKTCQKEAVKNNLKRNPQQVDKENGRYARMVG